MSASSFKITCLALLMAAGVATQAKAQLDDGNSPFYGPSNDLQFFEPLDLDLDGRGSGRPVGFFFRYDKQAVVTTGERIEVGDPNTNQLAFPVYGGTPLDPETGQPILRPILTNSIKNAVPRAEFDMGDRYEFGYWGEDGTGWLLSVLDGPDNIQTFNLGFDEDDDNFTQLDSVFVAFRTDPGVLAGFLDVVLADGSIDLDGDGFADDFDEDGQHGPHYFDLDGDGTPETILNVLPDYDGDLVTLTTGFTDTRTQNTLKVNGFEMMRGIRLDNDHFLVKNQNNHFEVGYGARFMQLDDNFLFDGFNGFALGDARWDTTIINNIVGPQVGYNWNHQRGRWNMSSTGKFMFGYNIRDWDQVGFIGVGPNAIQGDTNTFLLAPGKSFSHGKNDDDFSPVAELRANLQYRLTDNVAFNVGWTGTFVDNIKRASTHVDYAFHENGRVLGFSDGNKEELFSNAINVGIEVTQ